MKLLFDENISYRIVKKLKFSFPGSNHVSHTSLQYASTDRSIWEYAKTRGYTIVTFDEDFKHLADRLSWPPKVILLKSGNCSTELIINLLQNNLTKILAFNKSEIYGLMEIS
jgi:predicted nuclease of predicted toxin-antitoxin system